MLVKENAEEKENLPVAPGEHAALRADSIHAVTTQVRRFSGNFAAQWHKKKTQTPIFQSDPPERVNAFFCVCLFVCCWLFKNLN